MELPETIAVNRKALHRLLAALNGPEHYIREIQATRTPDIIGFDNPINILIGEYNEAMELPAPPK